MTPRISLRPAHAAAALTTLVAVVLALLCVTSILAKHGAEVVQPAASVVSVDGPVLGRAVAVGLESSAVAAGHRSVVVHPSERRLTPATVRQDPQPRVQGGAPDLPGTASGAHWYPPTDLVGLPIEAAARAAETTLSIAHRGRAPPAGRYGS